MSVASQVSRPRRVFPVWEGILKQKKSSLFQLGSEVWRDRLVQLDVQAGLLSIWKVKEGQESLASSVMSAKFSSDAMGRPKKVFDLNCVHSLDSDPHHLELKIFFSANAQKKKVKQTLQFWAPTLADFNRWCFVLGHFGLQRDVLGLDVEMRGSLTRAFSLESPNKRVKAAESVTGCVDDMEPARRSDDDMLDVLSTRLDDISPCNSEWCRKVGLKTKRKALRDVLSTALDGISPCNREWCGEVGLEPMKKAMRSSALKEPEQEAN